jgi:hypothetical protein
MEDDVVESQDEAPEDIPMDQAEGSVEDNDPEEVTEDVDPLLSLSERCVNPESAENRELTLSVMSYIIRSWLLDSIISSISFHVSSLTRPSLRIVGLARDLHQRALFCIRRLHR